MGLLTWLFGQNVLVIKHWALSDAVKLPYAVTTPFGGKFKNISCVVDIHYRVEADKLSVVRVCLANSTVWNSRRGESWDADFTLRRLLEGMLSKQIDQLIANDENLQRKMWGQAADYRLASDAQKDYAHALGIATVANITSKAISSLIDTATAQKRLNDTNEEAEARREVWRNAPRQYLAKKDLRGEKQMTLWEAARTKQPIVITYNAGENPGTQRRIIPKQLFKVKGANSIYLLAYDFRRKTDRTFKVWHIEID